MEVLKFGGTSLGSSTNMKKVFGLIQQKVQKTRLGIVVSATGGTTNFLIHSIVNSLSGQKTPQLIADEFYKRHFIIINELTTSALSHCMGNALSYLHECCRSLKNSLEEVAKNRFCSIDHYCRILSLGEKLAACIIFNLLGSMSKKIVLVDAEKMIKTAGLRHEGTVILDQVKDNFKSINDLNSDCFLMPGFIASTQKNELSLLGRNSSDYSGSLMAMGLQASCYEIWTDVNGLFDQDPHLHPHAQHIAIASYHDVLSDKFTKSKVLHPKTLSILIEQQIPIYIKNTFNPSHPGSKIVPMSKQTEATHY